MSDKIKKTLLGLAALTAMALGAAALAQGANSPDQPAPVPERDDSGERDDDSATGSEADKAKAAAVRITRGGTGNSVERDSENGAVWEVEVSRPGGGTVDVRLDGGYGEVAVEGDDEGGEEKSDEEQGGEEQDGAGGDDSD